MKRTASILIGIAAVEMMFSPSVWGVCDYTSGYAELCYDNNKLMPAQNPDHEVEFVINGSTQAATIPGSGTGTVTLTAPGTNTLYSTGGLVWIVTAVAVATGTGTGSATNTQTATANKTGVLTATWTGSASGTIIDTTTESTTETATVSMVQSSTAQSTGTVSASGTATATLTAAVTGTASASGTGTGTGNTSGTVTGTNTVTGTGSRTVAGWGTAVLTWSDTATHTGTVVTVTTVYTETQTSTFASAATISGTASVTATGTLSGTWTNTGTHTGTATSAAIAENPKVGNATTRTRILAAQWQSTDTSLYDVTGMSVPVSSGKSYRVTVMLHLTRPFLGESGDVQYLFAIGGTATVSSCRFLHSYWAYTGVTDGYRTLEERITTFGDGGVVDYSNVNDVNWRIDGIANVSGTGTIVLRGSTECDDPASDHCGAILANSYMQVEELWTE